MYFEITKFESRLSLVFDKFRERIQNISIMLINSQII